MNQALYAHMNNKRKIKKKRRVSVAGCLGENGKKTMFIFTYIHMYKL
jgi:hypothetical protein